LIRINLSETTAIRSSSSAAAEPAPAAVLLLDATGRVTAANASARALWQTGEAELVGEAFAALFAFEIVSSDPEFLEAQWEALLISGLDKTAALTAQPREGAPREVRVRLEKNLGSSPGYIAVILPPPAPVAAGAAGGDDRFAALSLLADKGSAGFFDLHLAAGHGLRHFLAVLVDVGDRACLHINALHRHVEDAAGLGRDRQEGAVGPPALFAERRQHDVHDLVVADDALQRGNGFRRDLLCLGDSFREGDHRRVGRQ
jgi:hypothetical protein